MTNDNRPYMDYFKSVPKTGVIYVIDKAIEAGYHPDSDDWVNLGQGAPETGSFNGKAVNHVVTIDEKSSEYAAVSGRDDLKEEIANYYNTMFRQGKSSHYTKDNICITGGGRLALSRVVTALGNINLGHFIPDYTAYEELLGMFKTFNPFPILIEPENGYKIHPEELKKEIVGRGLSSLLISNPCNPTGQVLMGDDLNEWVTIAKALDCLMIFDEFYSHFIYDKPGKILSSAEYIDDVNKDSVIIINGLTKNWRCPGWRIGWIVGPEPIIEKVSSVGSFLDGGAVHPLQQEAIKLLNPDKVKKDAAIIQEKFKEKRDYTVTKLKEMGFVIEEAPTAAFYVWVNLEKLPTPLQDCFDLFEEGLKEKVITVPGTFFDVNPGKRRMLPYSRYKHYSRISFGPSMEKVKLGLANLEKVIAKFK